MDRWRSRKPISARADMRRAACVDRVNPDYAKSEVGMAGIAGLYGQMGDYDGPSRSAQRSWKRNQIFIRRFTTAAMFT